MDVGYCIDLYADFARQGKAYLPFPDKSRHRDRPDILPDALSDLWKRMIDGGYAAAVNEVIPQFNGGLFADSSALPLSPEQADLLIRASEYDWTDVEPAISRSTSPPRNNRNCQADGTSDACNSVQFAS